MASRYQCGLLDNHSVARSSTLDCLGYPKPLTKESSIAIYIPSWSVQL